MIPEQLRYCKFVKVLKNQKEAFEARPDPKTGESKGWTFWTQFRYTYDEIKEWIEQGNNYGVITGPYSQIAAIDADHAFYVNLVEKNLPNTFSVKTSSENKRHFYFYIKNFPSDKTKILLKDPDGKTKEKGDIRYGNFYLVGPGSMHPDTGLPYKIKTDIPVAQVDFSEIENVLSHHFAESQSEKKRFELPEKTSKGDRDTTLFQFACSLKSRNDMTFEQVYAAVKSYNSDFCDPPLGDNAVHQKVKQAFKYNNETISLAPEDLLNDTYNAKRFSEENFDTIKFCNALKGWFVYNGEVWASDENGGKILSAANKTYNRLVNIPTENMSESFKKRWTSHVRMSGNEGKIKSFINLSKMNLSFNRSEFDKDNYLMCIKNGVFDLKNFKLLPFSPKYMNTMQAKVKYDPEAKCPNWERFLNIIFVNDKDMINYMQKVLGYCLTGDISKQMFFIMKGGGKNGKSTLLSTILYAFGDYATTLDSEGVVTKKMDDGIRNDLACLRKKRFIQISELDQSKNLHISVVKKCTTVAPMKVRFLNKEFFEMIPTFKMFLETNPLPNIKGEDEGTWRRLRLVEFDYQFDDGSIITNYQTECLNPEIDGIFNWLLEGLKKLNNEGENMPGKVVLSNDLYKKDENPMTEFVEENCELSDKHYTICSEFNKYYKAICAHNKNKYALGKKHITEAMDGLGVKKRKISTRTNPDSHGLDAYFGIKCITNIIAEKDWENSITAPSHYDI